MLLAFERCLCRAYHGCVDLSRFDSQVLVFPPRGLNRANKASVPSSPKTDGKTGTWKLPTALFPRRTVRASRTCFSSPLPKHPYTYLPDLPLYVILAERTAPRRGGNRTLVLQQDLASCTTRNAPFYLFLY